MLSSSPCAIHIGQVCDVLHARLPFDTLQQPTSEQWRNRCAMRSVVSSRTKFFCRYSSQRDIGIHTMIGGDWFHSPPPRPRIGISVLRHHFKSLLKSQHMIFVFTVKFVAVPKTCLDRHFFSRSRFSSRIWWSMIIFGSNMILKLVQETWKLKLCETVTWCLASVRHLLFWSL